jgi:hypothetical protein
MEASKDHTSGNKLVHKGDPPEPGVCIACGSNGLKRGRRYCSKKCRQQINWVLSLSKGLLKTINTRYAAFSFTQDHVILDTLPVWSNGISRFISKRTEGCKPAEDLKNLILQSGEEWHNLVNNKNSKSFASFFLITRRHKKGINPRNIRPDKKFRPRLTRMENACLRVLQLQRDDLSSDGLIDKIRAAYKGLAKRYHPDVGGDAEKFKKLNEAHEKMLLWTENPHYTARKALHHCWSYDGQTNRWSPPL